MLWNKIPYHNDYEVKFDLASKWLPIPVSLTTMRFPVSQVNLCGQARTFIHQAARRLTARSHEALKTRDSILNFSDRSEIWQAPR